VSVVFGTPVSLSPPAAGTTDIWGLSTEAEAVGKTMSILSALDDAAENAELREETATLDDAEENAELSEDTAAGVAVCVGGSSGISILGES
jgi:hypothetical protein